ncbi:hypothetical protein [Gordonibacter massiliensis (ex Traore et al. 2017)]|uniref:hypothetical protein n=1 Tax=Gordonibacter massiliensis (ex Traore et al. 2017) TaxID=1841863 RepID=UPI001C8B1D2F|nr:hypothetical protein [Gordonibacter massiliensis (ex Traore et al. 2017)]MBX9033557.1 hypothetical protein [Gordonibacter massiliensis (ex Traore et al. 2017)]
MDSNIAPSMLSIIAGIISVVGAVLTFLKDGRAGLFSQKASFLKRQFADIPQNVTSPSYEFLVSHYELLQYDRFAKKLGKEHSGRYISLSTINTVFMLLFLYLSVTFLFVAATQSSSIPQALWLGIATVSGIGWIFFYVLMAANLPVWAMRETLHGRRKTKESRKSGYYATFEQAANMARENNSFLFVDARPESVSDKKPLHGAFRLSSNQRVAEGSIEAASDANDIQAAISSKDEPVFVLSEYGVESHLIVSMLRKNGYFRAFDLGGVASTLVLAKRLAFELEFIRSIPKSLT